MNVLATRWSSGITENKRGTQTATIRLTVNPWHHCLQMTLYVPSQLGVKRWERDLCSEVTRWRLNFGVDDELQCPMSLSKTASKTGRFSVDKSRTKQNLLTSLNSHIMEITGQEKE